MTLFLKHVLRRRARRGGYCRAVLGVFVLIVGVPICAVEVYAQFVEGTDLMSLLFPIVVALFLLGLVVKEIEALGSDPLIVQGRVVEKGRFTLDGLDFGGLLQQAYQGRAIVLDVTKAMTVDRDGETTTDLDHLKRQTIPVTWRVHRRAAVNREMVLICTSAARGVATRSPASGVVFPADARAVASAPASPAGIKSVERSDVDG
jgi:hypothetical protein